MLGGQHLCVSWELDRALLETILYEVCVWSTCNSISSLSFVGRSVLFQNILYQRFHCISSLSFVGRSVLFQSVLYQRFHCVSSLSFVGRSVQDLSECPLSEVSLYF
jgi:hypothetical protein